MFCILDLETVPDDRLILDVYTENVGDTLATCRERFDLDMNARVPSSKPGRKPFPPLPYHKPVVAVLLVVDQTGRYINHRALTDEATIVDEFWSLMRQGITAMFFQHIVTFNGIGFDMPVMELRAMQSGLCIPEWIKIGAKSWEDPRHTASGIHLDLFNQFFPAAASKTSSAGLDVIAKMFGLPGKTEHGAGVAEMHAAGETGRITSYCAHDVLNTYGCLLRYLKASNCGVEPWADQPTFQHTCKMMQEFNTAAFAARAGSLAVAAREKAPF